jgi:hypothetical protein
MRPGRWIDGTSLFAHESFLAIAVLAAPGAKGTRLPHERTLKGPEVAWLLEIVQPTALSARFTGLWWGSQTSLASGGMRTAIVGSGNGQ